MSTPSMKEKEPTGRFPVCSLVESPQAWLPFLSRLQDLIYLFIYCKIFVFPPLRNQKMIQLGLIDPSGVFFACVSEALCGRC